MNTQETGKKSNVSRYREARGSRTREQASELLGCITPERLEKIENNKVLPHPDEVVVMADAYNRPDLCNSYCANDCPIGREYVPEIKMEDLSKIVLKMLSSLNSANRQKNRLIEITADGNISHDEVQDFVRIQEKLEQISLTVEALQLWSRKMLSSGKIDKDEYEKCRQEMQKKRD